jgi:hypothetical protein
VGLAGKWWEIERSLPSGWKEARISLLMHGERYASRAAELLGPANPVRRGLRISFYTAQHGAGVSPKAVARLLTRLDVEGLSGELALVSADVPEASAAAETVWLADAWDGLVAELPDDWSDVYAELALDSSDYLQPAALATAPLNPARWGGENAFRFRCARRFGYGASPGMVTRCMERLDESGITGSVRILWALADTQPVGTQGPVWYVGGRSV